MHIFRHIFLSNYWWQKSDIWSQASYKYPISWESFLDPSDSYFLFADLVGFYTHWTYMHIFRHLFLSNYWWQKSDIWSQASYRYLISWETFLDPWVSYFLFADLVGFYTHWTYMHIFRHIFLSNHWWQKSDIWSQASYKYTILWEAFLDPADSYFLFADLVGLYTHWTYMHICRHLFLSNYWWQKSDIWSQASYRYTILWESFLDPSDSYFLFADLVVFYTHWTYMHIFHHIFSATINGRNLIFGHKLHIGTSYRGKRFWTHRIPTSCLPTLLIFIHIYHTFVYAHFSSHFSQQLLTTGIWYLVTSVI